MSHAEEMAAVLDDPELHRYTGGRPLDVDELRERYAFQTRGVSGDGSARWLNWIMRAQSSGAAVGYVQATVQVESRTADLAWVVGSRHQGLGYAREAAAAVVGALRREGTVRITAHIHPENLASQAVARAVGLAPTAAVADGEVVWRSPSPGP